MFLPEQKASVRVFERGQDDRCHEELGVNLSDCVSDVYDKYFQCCSDVVETRVTAVQPSSSWMCHVLNHLSVRPTRHRKVNEVGKYPCELCASHAPKTACDYSWCLEPRVIVH